MPNLNMRINVCIHGRKTYICAMLWYQSIPLWLQKMFPSMVWQIPDKNEKVVYLTFDDGPHPEISLWVANQLKIYNMSATFFCVGENVKKNPETYKTLIQMGHVCGNHTMHHIKGWRSSTKHYIDDVNDCQAYFKTELFRPPYGQINTSQIKQLNKDYRIIMWSLLSCDFKKNLNIKKAIRGLTKKTKNGSIVVFHDSIKAEHNLKLLLPPYLEFLKVQGYICKTL